VVRHLVRGVVGEHGGPVFAMTSVVVGRYLV
jgi:hypothetical protein